MVFGMNTTKILVLLILLFMLMPVSLANEGDFTIPSVIKDITVNDDGSTVIQEEITYDIEGSVNGVYRDIPLSQNQSVNNISVETPGYYNKLEIISNSELTKLRVWLYTDEAKTQKTNNAKVKVIYHYTIIKGLKVYNDIAELQYMTWGDEWNSKVEYLESHIIIPGNKDNTEYWNNPDNKVISCEWTSNNILTTKLKNIRAHERFEQRIIMPKSYIKNTTYAQIVNTDAKNLIEQDQRSYAEEKDKDNLRLIFFFTAMAIFTIIPVGIYGLYGREPKIDYNAKYEYDLPTDESPVQVYVITRGKLKNIGNDAMYATILDLIDRNYFKIIFYNDDTVIRWTNKDTSALKEYERLIIGFLSSYAVNGDIFLGNIARQNRKAFQNFRKSWIEQAKEEIPPSYIEKYFDDKGLKIFQRIRHLYILLVLAVFIIIFFRLIPSTFILELLAVLLLIIPVFYIIMWIVPRSISGRWTPQGKETYQKWKNFERYIKDYSLISQRPPASVQVWGRYMVYAMALGCADKATENMRKYFETNQIHDDSFNDINVVFFAYHGGIANMESSFNTLSRTDSSTSGIGHAGSGGFGGGGGGTF
ncbi:MAG: DUF2207 domain-containing protein [Methanosphaera stadtmanae]|jgi:uncharacterized membrane protein|nr:DUF2207 domain-containing protein [Methanosphaera stadtmanae]